MFAKAFGNPDHVSVVIHNYRWRVVCQEVLRQVRAPALDGRHRTQPIAGSPSSVCRCGNRGRSLLRERAESDEKRHRGAVPSSVENRRGTRTRINYDQDMALSLSTVTRISRTIAREDFPGVSVNGSTSADIDNTRAEVMITTTVDDREPGRLTLNVTRSDRVSFEREFRDKLTAALAERTELNPQNLS
jgi:hypothetical protein